jgi:hypothetical protein
MQGWSNPNTGISQPTITELSTNKSHATLLTIVAVLGTNFRPYSTIRFGGYSPDIIFINSEHIEFYVPQIVTTPSTFTVQVFNATVGSNIVNYSLDTAINFWILNTEINKLKNYNSNGGLEITGDLSVSGNIKGNAISNYTVSYKRDSSNIKDVTELVNKSNIIIDDFIPFQYYDSQTSRAEFGFFADKIPSSCSNLITGSNSRGTHTINYNGIIAILVKEVQSLKARILSLETKNT